MILIRFCNVYRFVWISLLTGGSATGFIVTSSTIFKPAPSASRAIKRQQCDANLKSYWEQKQSLRTSVKIVAPKLGFKHSTSTLQSTKAETTSANEGILERIAGSIAKRQTSGQIYPKQSAKLRHDRRKTQILTLLRVGIPSVLSGIFATVAFPGLALFLASWITDPGTFTVLSQDSSQFVQNFLSVSSLLFSILVGQTCKLSVLSCISTLIRPLRRKTYYY
jgi:hypothetical protein